VTDFQRALLELAYANYPGTFLTTVRSMLPETKNARIYAMCAVYILQSEQEAKELSFLEEKTKARLLEDPHNPILEQLHFQVKSHHSGFKSNDLHNLFNKDFLPGNVLMFSFQRKNRNYPGLVIVRDAAGNFIEARWSFIFCPATCKKLFWFAGLFNKLAIHQKGFSGWMGLILLPVVLSALQQISS
jgi:hypothetical protein